MQACRRSSGAIVVMQPLLKQGKRLFQTDADVAKLVDARDLKSHQLIDFSKARLQNRFWKSNESDRT